MIQDAINSAIAALSDKIGGFWAALWAPYVKLDPRNRTVRAWTGTMASATHAAAASGALSEIR